MCCNGKCEGHHGCWCSRIAKILLIVGGVNWGLVGVGMLMGSELNIVTMLLGSMPTVEAIVYILVGISALVKLFGCRCSKCKEACASCATEAPKM